MPDESPPLLTCLDEVALVRADGADATSFLHAQLSCDMNAIPADGFGFGAWHSPSGKVRALFWLVRSDSGWLLTEARDAVGETLASLARYVLRDDVSLRTADPEWRVAALTGESAAWLREAGVKLGPSPRARARFGSIEWLRLGPELVYAIGTQESLDAIRGDLAPGDGNVAVAAEIALGIPALASSLRDRFVPQLLNLDLLGALDAGKGCYPGQEIIARTQNLGAVKRRMLRFSSPASTIPATGSAILCGDGEPAGEVVRAAAMDSGIELLGIVRLSTLDQALYCETDTATRLRREPLPYDPALIPLPASGAGTE